MSGERCPMQDPPVTAVLEVHVRPGVEREFEAAMTRLIQTGIRQPGHLGANVFRPTQPGDPYRFVYKFDRRSNLDAWHHSDLRKGLIQAARPFVQMESTQTETGLETWFSSPMMDPPPRWKTTLVSWVSVFPVTLAVNAVIQAAGLKLPIVVHSLLTTLVVVPTVAFAVGPWVGRRFQGWLHRREMQNSALRVENPALETS